MPVLFWVSAEEMEFDPAENGSSSGRKNLSAYLRKMALDGYVVKLDLPELKELVSLHALFQQQLESADPQGA